MYHLFIYIYLLGVAIASLFSTKVKRMWRGERQAFDVLRSKVDPQAHYIWFHAASLGEFEQGRPLIEFIRRRFPAYRILLTFFSPSGYEVRKDYQGADIICYLPIDTISNARRFLRLVRPEIAFFIKYEFWYNYLHILKHRNIPTYSVSSIFREGQVFFKWYGRSYAKVLNCFTRFFVQNEQSRLLLARIGITDVDVVGDTRFDRVLQIKQTAPELPIVEAFRQNHPVFVAGSSWPPDEDIFIRFFNEHRDWRLIIAPHVIAEDHLQQILSKLNRKAVRYTCTTPGDAREADCLLIDCFGLLSGIYRYGDVAYVGGGFGVGIHNVLEAAVWGVPVIFGPNNRRFQEAQGLFAAQGGFEIDDYASFEHTMRRFVDDSSIRQEAGTQASTFVSSLAGATETIFDNVFPAGNQSPLNKGI